MHVQLEHIVKCDFIVTKMSDILSIPFKNMLTILVQDNIC